MNKSSHDVVLRVRRIVLVATGFVALAVWVSLLLIGLAQFAYGPGRMPAGEHDTTWVIFGMLIVLAVVDVQFFIRPYIRWRRAERTRPPPDTPANRWLIRQPTWLLALLMWAPFALGVTATSLVMVVRHHGAMHPPLILGPVFALTAYVPSAYFLAALIRRETLRRQAIRA